MEYAIELGSDCPFFIHDYPQYAEGRGEVLEKIDIDLKGKHLLIINPNIHISTQEAFATIKPTESISCKEIVLQDMSTWKENLSNDFEASIFPKYPVLKTLKNKLYDLGALYASMSGSGSTMYAIFNEAVNIETLPKEHFTWQGKL
jgi:4-diphosphocytidyl-2-C-methyl-D-erythritol kinase